jgi:plastocyanin
MLVLAIACSASAPAAAPGPSSPAPSSAAPSVQAATPTPTASSTGGPVLIQMAEHYYDPAQLVIAVGTTVVWRNVGIQTHDIHARDGSFESPGLGPGGTFTYTFTKAGKYPYYCAPHEGDGMIGVIEVR